MTTGHMRLATCAMLCGSIPSAAAHAPPTTAATSAVVARIDAIVEAARVADKIPGVTLLVEHGGRILIGRGYGQADVENDVPTRLETVYQIASLTKQFTSAAIMQLVEQGKVRLDDDVRRFVPELRIRRDTITVHHLLSHTHGLSEYNPEETRQDWSKPITQERVVAFLNDRDVEFKPGAKFQYRNSGYYLLGMIVERAGGMPYGEYLRTKIFEPLGMSHTSQCTSREIIPKRAHGYTLDDARQLRNPRFLDMSWTFAVGSLCSTAPDLLRWDHALRSGRVVTPDSYRRMTAPVTLADGTVTDYGYGLGRSVHDGHVVIRHGGNTVGFASYLTHYPADDLTIIVLTNSDVVQAWIIDDDIARAVLAMPPSKDHPPILR